MFFIARATAPMLPGMRRLDQNEANGGMISPLIKVIW